MQNLGMRNKLGAESSFANEAAPSRLAAAVVWPFAVMTQPALVAGSAAGAFAITGALPWQTDWEQGLRYYGLGAAIFFAGLQVLKADAEVTYTIANLPPFVKKMLGF